MCNDLITLFAENGWTNTSNGIYSLESEHSNILIKISSNGKIARIARYVKKGGNLTGRMSYKVPTEELYSFLEFVTWMHNSKTHVLTESIHEKSALWPNLAPFVLTYGLIYVTFMSLEVIGRLEKG